MPVMNVNIRAGRSLEQKDALAREITQAVHETIGALRESRYVLILENPGSLHFKDGQPLPEF
ncbi:tautomerase family protein [Desulfonatronum thiosulfatophilum]|uniref:tautomerase family protein n=1 Tax=Desulfonatronum thiosulfatophilum TaxID=617002 RepID=UPI001113F7E8|nr:tautomerase family protein [Desulfonatronum thiosulfatophilum]